MDLRVFRQVSLFSRRRRPKFFLLSLAGYCDCKRAISFSFNDKFQLLVKMLFSFFAVSILNNKKGFLFLFFFKIRTAMLPALRSLANFIHSRWKVRYICCQLMSINKKVFMKYNVATDLEQSVFVDSSINCYFGRTLINLSRCLKESRFFKLRLLSCFIFSAVFLCSTLNLKHH